MRKDKAMSGAEGAACEVIVPVKQGGTAPMAASNAAMGQTEKHVRIDRKRRGSREWRWNVARRPFL